MENTIEPIESDVQKEASDFAIKSAIARALQLTQQDVHLQDLNPEKNRFIYGTTEHANQQEGFFKMGKASETNEQLRRESVGLTIAKRIGIPTVSILHPYQDTPEGGGILHVERLDSEHGTLLTNAELIAGADPKLGANAARALALSTGKEIPEDIDSSILKRGDWRVDSLDSFNRVWDEENDIVLNTQNKEFVDKQVGFEKLKAIVDQTRDVIDPLIQAGDNPNAEYFVHNDTSPENVFYGDDGSVTFLDFEHASATHNQFLAQLADLGNFYGRMWANPQMQQEFLTTFLQESTPKNLDYNYQLIRATAVFGSMFLAKYAMSPDHSEHPMAQALLGSLTENLAKLDDKYEEISKRDDNERPVATTHQEPRRKLSQKKDTPKTIPRTEL